MALLLVEGFDHEAAHADLLAGIFQQADSGTALASSASRWGTGKYCTVNSSPNYNTMPLPGTYGSGACGAAVKIGALQGGQGIGFFDVGANAYQLWAGFDAGGTLHLYRGSVSYTMSATSLASYSGVNPSVWNYIELSATIGSSASAVVQVNGVPVITVAGVNTQATGNASFGAFVIAAIAYTGGAMQVDDVYVTDTTGGPPWNGLLGDCRIQTLFPTSNDSVQWTPLAGANWSEVDETAMDSDTSYVLSNSPGQRDTYDHGALTGSIAAIYGVQVTTCARKDDSSTHTLANVLLSGSASGSGSAAGIASSYSYQKSVFETDPNTSGAWTVAAVNASRHGYNLVS